MQQEFSIAIASDSVINRRISLITDERFLAIVKLVRDADVGYTHLETLLHDYDGPEMYPAAEAGWTWQRAPRFVAEELKWAGFDMVSTAHNHSLDYSYGGLYSTWKALDDAGLVYAGTGKTLGEARSPAYLETPKGRVALISMTASFVAWSRAGDTRPDVKGRPGVNPLRFYYEVNAKTMQQVKDLFMKLDFMLRQQGKMLTANPPGLHNTVTRFVEGDQPGVTTRVNEEDAEGNLRAIKDARRQADYVIVHLHDHMFHYDAEKGESMPAQFIPPFARACIDAGADVFIDEGGAGAQKGIELHKGKPIFYDLGGFLLMSSTVTRLPADFYYRPGYPEEVRSPKATPADAFDARIALPKAFYPPGYVPGGSARILTSFMAVCSFGPERGLTGIKLYPLAHTKSPRSQIGIPLLADAEESKNFVEFMNKVSSPYGTKIEYKDGIGLVKP